MVVIFILAFGVTPTWTWLLFPVILVMLIVLTTAVSMIVASLYPRFRDIAIIWTVFSTVLFYATPILYTAIDRWHGHPRCAHHPAQPAGADLRAGPQVDHPAQRAWPGGRGRWLCRVLAPAGDLHRHLRVRGLDLPARGAADRRSSSDVGRRR